MAFVSDDHAKLAEVYDRACDKLVDVYGYSAEQLAEAIEPVTLAMLKIQRAGERDEAHLETFAAERALAGKRAETRRQPRRRDPLQNLQPEISARFLAANGLVPLSGRSNSRHDFGTGHLDEPAATGGPSRHRAPPARGS